MKDKQKVPVQAEKLGGPNIQKLGIKAEYYIDSAEKLPELPPLNDANINLTIRQPLNQKDVAVVLIDLQKDFTTYYTNQAVRGGRLGVPVPVPETINEPKSDEVYIQKTIQATKYFHEKGLKIIGTLDSHPQDHISFASNHIGQKDEHGNDIIPNVSRIILPDGRPQIMWPDHCVRPDSSMKPENAGGIQTYIPWQYFTILFPKGTQQNFDSYSGAQDKGGTSTGLIEYLNTNLINHVIVYGLATDVCVADTVVDLQQKGIEVTVVLDLCRAAFSTKKGVRNMESVGATVLDSLESDNTIQM